MLFVGLFPLALAAEFGVPHPHRETREPFTATTPFPKLSSTDLATLSEGNVVLKQTNGKSSGVGVAVEDVAAPPAIVWSQLLSFETYPSKVPRVKVCENYAASARELKTRFVVHVCPGYNMEYFVRHVRNDNALTWTLDYDHRSDIDDVHGIWRVSPHPDKRDWSRVEYSADLRLKIGVPGFILDTLTKKALREACTWIKTESEKQYQNSSGDHPYSLASLLDASLHTFETSVLDVANAIHRGVRHACFTDAPVAVHHQEEDATTKAARRRRHRRRGEEEEEEEEEVQAAVPRGRSLAFVVAPRRLKINRRRRVY
ncbi:hypothetical protein CTAYLR_008965 [Chrysophaeum taylorii]|uniref:Coenzyme Q-binding protein COQ10 START domain-containing protein n=1 Tax=Chrysophaeum taylorii TaxID=2483200 RepID=A0AAD7XLC8_9STRA|nr:hypothetical protein CTAYLR_008965 [Chrysophaeum taylorii]